MGIGSRDKRARGLKSTLVNSTYAIAYRKAHGRVRGSVIQEVRTFGATDPAWPNPRSDRAWFIPPASILAGFIW